MSISNFIQAVSFHFWHPIKGINLCMGDTEFRRVKRRSIPLVVRQGIAEVKECHHRSPWYYNEPGHYPMSKAFEDWAYEMGVYTEVDYWQDYGLDFNDFSDFD